MIRNVILTLLSLAAIAVALLGTLSFWYQVPAYHGDEIWVCLRNGGVHVQCNHSRSMFTIALGVDEWPWGYYLRVPVGFGHVHFWFTPFWQPVLLLLAYPVAAFAWRVFRGRRRNRMGLCERCGYNLTGNISGVCPECGQKIPSEQRG